MINKSAVDLIRRCRSAMASTDADAVQADLAESFRTAADYLDITGPSDAEFREGVDSAVAELRQLADDIANYPR